MTKERERKDKLIPLYSTQDKRWGKEKKSLKNHKLMTYQMFTYDVIFLNRTSILMNNYRMVVKLTNGFIVESVWPIDRIS